MARRPGAPGRGDGRAVGQLLADHGSALPQRVAQEAAAADVKLFPRLRSPRGRRERGAGWSTGYAPLSQWRMTSDQAPVFWPFIAAPSLPPTGAQMGIDEFSGGSFYCDPNGWVLDEEIPVTNANVIAFGKPGSGKSSFVKEFAIRMGPFGYRSLILGDSKDEYEPLCGAFGVEPFAIGPGMWTRVNPLDVGPLGHDWDRLHADEARRRAADHLRALAGPNPRPGRVPTCGGAAGPVLPVRRAGRRHRAARADRLPHREHQAAAGDHPAAVAGDRRPHRRPGRRLPVREPARASSTARDCCGTRCRSWSPGIWPACSTSHTNIDIDWNAPIQSLSLKRLNPLGDDAVGLGLTCLNSWGTAQREISAPGDRRIVVRDEVWKQMRLGVEAVKSLDSDLRLSRSDGDVQVVVAHKPSDTRAVGAEGSEADRIARDLLHLADTKVLFGQDQAVGDELGDLLGLTSITQDIVTGWAMQARGRALWLVGDRTLQGAGRASPARGRPDLHQRRGRRHQIAARPVNINEPDDIVSGVRG